MADLPERDPFESASLRHERSLERLYDVQEGIGMFADVCRSGLFAYRKPQSKVWRPLPDLNTVLPISVSLNVSEMLYNLKAALDYSVYALFKQSVERGRIPVARVAKLEKLVDFPLKDSPGKLTDWKKSIGFWLYHRHWTLIESAQPYKRTKRHKRMAFLGGLYHNLDKHRDIQPLVPEFDLRGGTAHSPSALARSYGFDTKAVFAEPEMAMYRGGTVVVTFEDGSPVESTLKILHQQVGVLIDRIHARF